MLSFSGWVCFDVVFRYFSYTVMHAEDSEWDIEEYSNEVKNNYHVGLGCRFNANCVYGS